MSGRVDSDVERVPDAHHHRKCLEVFRGRDNGAEDMGRVLLAAEYTGWAGEWVHASSEELRDWRTVECLGANLDARSR
jgi:hypothetical protein